MCVAGKRAQTIRKYLQSFFLEQNGGRHPPVLPFDLIREMLASGNLYDKISESSLGQHRKLFSGFKQLVNSNFCLRTVSAEELESIHGIGPKTARYFILYSRPNSGVACLDRHQLRYLREEGYSAPNTLNQAQYKHWEKIYLEHLKKKNIQDIASFDLEIWLKYAKI